MTVAPVDFIPTSLPFPRIPLKRLFTVVNGATPKSDIPEYWDGDIIWVTPEDISATAEHGFISSSRRQLTHDGYNNCGATLVPQGSIVLTTRAPIGNLGITTVDLCTNQGCKALVPLTDAVDPRFFYYQLLSLEADLKALGNGTTFLELSATELSRIKLSVPPHSVQKTIAAFLDCDLSKTQRLISHYVKLTTLLEEQRTAIISNAVTRGLTSHAPMKYSGSTWLGDIPNHWTVCPLKHVLDIPLSNGIFVKKDQFGEGTPLINVYDIYQNRSLIDLADLDRVSISQDDIRTYLVRENDIFLVRSSLKAEGVARTAIIETVPESAVFECHLIRLRSSAKLHPRYLAYFLNSDACHSRLFSLSNTTTMTTISQPSISSLPICVPPLEEQLMIALYIERETKKIESLIDRAKDAVALLIEHRTSLIVNAMEGRLDQRVSPSLSLQSGRDSHRMSDDHILSDITHSFVSEA